MKLLGKMTLGVATIAAAAAFAPIASAAPSTPFYITVSDGTNTVTVDNYTTQNPNTTNDSNPGARSIAAFALSVGGYTVDVNGTYVDGPSFARLTETAIVVSCATAGACTTGLTFTISYSGFTYAEAGWTLNGTNSLAMSDLSAGVVATMQSFLGATGSPIASVTGLGSTAVSNTTTWSATVTDPFTMYSVVNIGALGNSGSASFTATTTAVPAPSIVFSLGGALLGLGLLRRRQIAR